MNIKTCLALDEVEINLYSHTRVADRVELYHDLVELLMPQFISIVVQDNEIVVVEIEVQHLSQKMLQFKRNDNVFMYVMYQDDYAMDNYIATILTSFDLILQALLLDKLSI